MLAQDFHHGSQGLTLWYNAVAHIDQQNKSASSSVLQSLAELFVRHGVHDRFGIFLLHRHRALTHNSVMVHTRPDINTDICVMEELGCHKISPCMFLSQTPNEFLPFEYELSSRAEAEPLPNKPFLIELGNFLWDRRLQETFGLCKASPADDPWIERLLSDDGNTIATRARRSITSLDGTITQWGFLREGQGIRIRELRACKESESGGHIRT